MTLGIGRDQGRDAPPVLEASEHLIDPPIDGRLVRAPGRLVGHVGIRPQRSAFMAARTDVEHMPTRAYRPILIDTHSAN